MNQNTLEKIITIVLHPATDEGTAMNAFRKLHQNASEFGGLKEILSDEKFNERIRERTENLETELKQLRQSYWNLFTEKQEIESDRNSLNAKCILSERRASEVESASRSKQKRIEKLEAEIADFKANPADDELGIIAKQHAQIADLAAKFKAVNQALAEAEASRERYAAEQAAAVRDDIKTRVMSAFADEAPAHEGTAESQQEEAPAKPKRASAKKAKSAASAKPRSRPQRATRRGADAERIVDDALTFDWKSVSTLFREAQNRGFKGTENAIRFAAERLVAVGNAIAGYNNEGRIAYRRA